MWSRSCICKLTGEAGYRQNADRIYLHTRSFIETFTEPMSFTVPTTRQQLHISNLTVKCWLQWHQGHLISSYKMVSSKFTLPVIRLTTDQMGRWGLLLLCLPLVHLIAAFCHRLLSLINHVFVFCSLDAIIHHQRRRRLFSPLHLHLTFTWRGH